MSRRLLFLLQNPTHQGMKKSLGRHTASELAPESPACYPHISWGILAKWFHLFKP